MVGREIFGESHERSGRGGTVDGYRITSLGWKLFHADASGIPGWYLVHSSSSAETKSRGRRVYIR